MGSVNTETIQSSLTFTIRKEEIEGLTPIVGFIRPLSNSYRSNWDKVEKDDYLFLLLKSIVQDGR